MFHKFSLALKTTPNTHQEVKQHRPATKTRVREPTYPVLKVVPANIQPLQVRQLPHALRQRVQLVVAKLEHFEVVHAADAAWKGLEEAIDHVHLGEVYQLREAF